MEIINTFAQGAFVLAVVWLVVAAMMFGFAGVASMLGNDKGVKNLTMMTGSAALVSIASSLIHFMYAVCG